MTLLIVDDEIHSTEGLKHLLDYSALGIDEVLTANSVKQAREIFDASRVDILLTDVEMPRENGFVLLAWLKEKGLQPVTMILTSYADFNYAQQAVSFHVNDYLLKPVTTEALERALTRAVEVAGRMNDAALMDFYASYYENTMHRNTALFLQEVLRQPVLCSEEELFAKAAGDRVRLISHSHYLPILFTLYGQDRNWTGTRIESIRREVFGDSPRLVSLMYENDLLCIISGNDDPEPLRTEMIRRADAFIQSVPDPATPDNPKVSAFFGTSGTLHEALAQCRPLQALRRRNVTETPRVFFLGETAPASSGTAIPEYEQPNIDLWVSSFLAGAPDKTLDAVSHYLDLMTASGRLTKEMLNQLFHSFLQAFSGACTEKGLEMRLIFADDDSLRLFREAADSTRTFKDWVHHLLEKTSVKLNELKDDATMVEAVRSYIKAHLSEDLSREQITGAFYISPDYLSKLFHHETGMKLVEYITNLRIEEAARLLMTTDKPVGEVASATGFSSSAYFSRVFRVHYGMSPNQFRDSPKSQ